MIFKCGMSYCALWGGVAYPWLLNNINSDIERLPVYHDSEGDYIIVPDTVYEADHNRIFGGYIPLQGLVSNGELIAVRAYANFATAGSRINIIETLLDNGSTRIEGFGLLATYYINSTAFWHFSGTITAIDTITAISLVGYTEGSLFRRNELCLILSTNLDYAFSVENRKPHCTHGDLPLAEWCNIYYECYYEIDGLQRYRGGVSMPWPFILDDYGGEAPIRFHYSLDGGINLHQADAIIPLSIGATETVDSLAILLTANDNGRYINSMTYNGVQVNGENRIVEERITLPLPRNNYSLPINIKLTLMGSGGDGYHVTSNESAFIQGLVG